MANPLLKMVSVIISIGGKGVSIEGSRWSTINTILRSNKRDWAAQLPEEFHLVTAGLITINILDQTTPILVNKLSNGKVCRTRWPQNAINQRGSTLGSRKSSYSRVPGYSESSNLRLRTDSYTLHHRRLSH